LLVNIKFYSIYDIFIIVAKFGVVYSLLNYIIGKFGFATFSQLCVIDILMDYRLGSLQALCDFATKELSDRQNVT